MYKIDSDIGDLIDILNSTLLFIDEVNLYHKGYLFTSVEMHSQNSELTPDEIDDKKLEKIERFREGWSYTIGKNWLRLIHNGKVYAFICINPDKNTTKKIKPWLKTGDILRPASYAQPSLNFNRGNVLTGDWKKYVSEMGFFA